MNHYSKLCLRRDHRIQAYDVSLQFLQLKLQHGSSYDTLQVSCTPEMNEDVVYSKQDEIQEFLQTLQENTSVEKVKLSGEFKDEYPLACQVVNALSKQKNIKYLEIDLYPGFTSGLSFLVYSLTDLKELELRSHGAVTNCDILGKELECHSSLQTFKLVQVETNDTSKRECGSGFMTP